MKKLLLLVALALAAVPAATAGGFATVELSSLPTEVSAGGTWSVDLTVKAHGRTPLEGLSPVVRVSREGGGGDTLVYAARPTGTIGVYHANVVFPEEGTWRYEISDGYIQVHTYKPVEIAPAARPSSFPLAPVTAAALAAALGGALLLVLRRARTAPRPAAVRR